jgi:hypothetical protein
LQALQLVPDEQAEQVFGQQIDEIWLKPVGHAPLRHCPFARLCPAMHLVQLVEAP